jgi:hypothetical protein
LGGGWENAPPVMDKAHAVPPPPGTPAQ